MGATLAATLAAAGLPTAVVDSAPLPPMELQDFDGRAYAIALTSKRLLEASGIWDRLPAEPCPITAIRVADGRPGEPASRLSLHFRADEVGPEPFGYMVEARSLRVALNARLPAMENLQVFAPATATVERQAEGRRSASPPGRCSAPDWWWRRKAATARCGARPASGWRCSTTTRSAWWAPSPMNGRTGMSRWSNSCPMAPSRSFLAGPGGFGSAAWPHASAFVWADRTVIARRMLALDDAAFGRELARRLGDHLGAIRPIGRRWSYPLSALQVERWTDTRLALIGDAAHGVHPIAGQGLNLGFRDVAALAEEMTAAWNAGADPGAPTVLARYQARRRPDTLLMLTGMHALERLFGNDFAPVRIARRLGIAAVDRIPALKRGFARQAMGLGPG
ncbi:FAD-dependent monooxygenase [Siccirubricoccus deserti]